MEFATNWNQDKRIALLEQTAATATKIALDAQARCASLEEQLARLSFQSHAISELLREKYNLPRNSFLPPPEPATGGPPPLPELYGPVPPPPILVCINCNTRFQNAKQICPNCSYRTITNTLPNFKPHFDT